MAQPKRLMLIEDSPTQAARLRRLFEQENLEVVHVPSAELGLEQLETAPVPDVIVLDYHLPGMDGNEFCRAIRLKVNTRAIPVLMLTAEDSSVAEMQGLASGADDYVAKSSDLDILRVRVLALLRSTEGVSAVTNVENRFGRARILVIDDSPTYLHHMLVELETEHYTVEIADSPAQGLVHLRETSFDCVLIDFEMPGLDGAEVCRAIRTMRRGSEPEIVLVMVTSHEDKSRMALSFEAGADDYISKSTDMAVTKARIRALLRRKFLIEENRRIFERIKEKELETLRARAASEAAEVRATMADQLAAANRRLENANQELEQFAYAAAHDLQEPLRQIHIFSELLQSRMEGRLDPETRGYLDLSIQGTARMGELIKDLLLYAGTIKSAQRPQRGLDLRQALDKALLNLDAIIKDSGAEVICGPLPSLFVDEIRFQQLFQNLISNAIKYRRPGESPRIEVSAERAGSMWVFSIADNGIGIAREYWNGVFEAFKRLNPANYSGTGLGLAICKRIVDQLGGSISVESEVGKGSTFKFAIPATFTAPEHCQLSK